MSAWIKTREDVIAAADIIARQELKKIESLATILGLDDEGFERCWLEAWRQAAESKASEMFA